MPEPEKKAIYWSMMRHIKTSILLLLLALFNLTACSKDEAVATTPADSTPDCKYSLPENPPSLTSSPSPALMSAPFDQSKLTTLISLSASDDTCFIRYQGKVAVYKITETFAALSVGEQNPDDPLFTMLAPAPEDLITPWKDLEERFNLPLMGVTFTRFFDRPEHREIVETRIVMNPKARPWHLWHEFGHFLISQTRLKNVAEKLTAPTENDIETAIENFRESLEKNEAEDAAAKLTELIDIYGRYDKRVHLEEIAIELTLLHYSEEATIERVAAQDPNESLDTVNFFYKTHINWYRSFFTQIRPLVKAHPELKTQLATMQKSLEENDRQIFEQIRKVREKIKN